MAEENSLLPVVQELRRNNKITEDLLKEKRLDDTPKQILASAIPEVFAEYDASKSIGQKLAGEDDETQDEIFGVARNISFQTNLMLKQFKMEGVFQTELINFLVQISRRIPMAFTDSLGKPFENLTKGFREGTGDFVKTLNEEFDDLKTVTIDKDKDAVSREKENKKDAESAENDRNKSLMESFTEPFKGLKESFNGLTDSLTGKVGLTTLLFITFSALFAYFEPAAQALADLLTGTGRFFGDFGKAFRGEITFKEFFENNLIGTVVALLVPFTKTFRTVFKFIFASIRRIFLVPFLAFKAIEGAIDGFMEAFNSGAGPLEIFYSTIEGAILGIGEGIRTLLLGLVDLIVPERFREDVKSFVNGAIDMVLDVIKGAFDFLKSGAAFLDDLGGKILGFFGFGDGDDAEGRYMGGPVAAGTPYIVGERGPELFVPGAAGGIVPGMGGGMTMVVNNNQVNQSSTTNNQQHSNISIVDEQQERVGL